MTINIKAVGSSVITATVNDGSTTSSQTMTLTINGKAITLTADAKSKTYGDNDPMLTYQITSGTLESGDSLSGSLTRDSGENVSTYAINQGGVANSNYAITFVAANLTINKANQSTIVINNITKSVARADFSPTIASGGSGTGSIIATFSSSPSIATIVSNQIHIVAVGTTTITAYKQGDTNYNDSNTTIFVLTVITTPPVANNSTLDIKLLPQNQTAQASTLTATDVDGDSLSYSITQTPVRGSVSITNASTGAYTYTTNGGQTSADTDSFEFQVSDGFATDTADVTVNLKTDPLYQYQWHLSNTGQTNFATNGGTAGEDINASGAIIDGLTGSNTIVAVVDGGLEIAHEDLSANVVVNGSHDFVGNDNDPTNPSTTGDHGTSVAGLIAARGWNNIGSRGVAPLASLKGFNYLKNQSTSNFIYSLGGASYSNDVDIFNQSIGIGNTNDFLIDSTKEAQYLSGVSHLREGKGAIYIKSAGNGFEDYGNNANQNNDDCQQANNNNLTCQNANMDAYKTLPYNITVGALNAQGKKSSYSTAGSSVWISAPGGEDGFTNPAMMTTDQSGCNQGYSRANGFVSGHFIDGDSPHAENPQCNYTSDFNGTSSAAPVTSGVVALMLEANPNLTWRDVKHILATTSDQVDTALSTTTITINGASYDAEPAWLTNAAGHKFHNYYGFGRVNAGSATTAAKAYTLGSLGTLITTAWIGSGAIAQSIPDNNATGTTHTIADSNNLTIEAVQIRVNATHPYTRDLAIELTAPSGTKSVLFNAFNGFFSSDLDMVLLSNAFYEENSSGNWTIRVLDAETNDTGTLNNWSIRFFGH